MPETVGAAVWFCWAPAGSGWCVIPVIPLVGSGVEIREPVGLAGGSVVGGATGDEVGMTGRLIGEDPVLPFFPVLLSLVPFPV